MSMTPFGIPPRLESKWVFLTGLVLAGLLSAAGPARADPAHHQEWRPGAPSAPAQPVCSDPAALGTSRIVALGTTGGFALGFKTYPRSLALEDHEVVLTFD